MKSLILMAGLLASPTVFALRLVEVKIPSPGDYVITISSQARNCFHPSPMTLVLDQQQSSYGDGPNKMIATVNTVADSIDGPSIMSADCPTLKQTATGFFQTYGETKLTIQLTDPTPGQYMGTLIDQTAIEKVFEGRIDVRIRKVKAK